jgi:hypothetical protein
MRLDFYEDPEHGWLAVPLGLLDYLGILDQVSRYSYMRGKFAHLEEDCDCSLFWAAAQRAGLKFQVRTRRTNNRSRIRNYCQFHPGVARVWLQNARDTSILLQGDCAVL